MHEALSPLQEAGFIFEGREEICEGYHLERWSFPGGFFRACVDVFQGKCYSGRIFSKGGIFPFGWNSVTDISPAEGIMEFIRTQMSTKIAQG